jgi:diguanylate cyclase (GGDEF)-like protein/PAS domain S-box-containing protein
LQVDKIAHQMKAISDRIALLHQHINPLSSPLHQLLTQTCEELSTIWEDVQVAQAVQCQPSEERFRCLSACSPVGIFLTDIEGRCTYTNPRCQAICGFTFEESLGEGWLQSVHPGDRERVFAQWCQSTCQGQEYSDEFRCQTRETEVRWVHVRSSPMFSHRGELIGHVGTVEDITERKQAEQALKQANEALEIRVEERIAQLRVTNDQLLSEVVERKRAEIELEKSLSLLRATLEATADGIIVTQNASDITLFNQKFVQMWGISESVIGSRELSLVLPLILEQLKDPEAFICETQGLFAQPEAEAYGMFELKDGRIFERYSCPQRLGEKIVGRVCSFRDITQRKRAEKALRESEATNRALLNAIPDLMITMARDGTYLDFIPAKNFKTLMPSSGDARGKNVYDVMPLEFAKQRMHYVEKALSTGETQIYEFELEWENGNISHEEARIVVCGEDEVLVIIRDITDRKRMEEALRESEERYRRIIETTSEGVWIIDAENQTIFANNRMAQMLGYNLDEILNQPVLTFVHEKWQAIAAVSILHLSKGNRETFDLQFCRKDGSNLWVMVSANPIFDQAGQYVGALGMFTDITERKRAEVEVQQSEQKYRNLFHNSLVGMFRNSLADGAVLDANAAVLKMFGYDSYEGVKAADVYVNPTDRENLKQQLLERGFVENFEAPVRRKDGSVFWVSYSARSYPKDGYLEGVMIDISERKQSEEALRANEEFLQLVLDNIPQFIFWKDRNSVYLGCNRNFARAAGFNSPDEIVGKTDYDLPWRKEESDFFHECDARVIRTDTPEYHIIEPQLQADGKQAWLDTSKIPLHDSDGNVVGILGSYEDITERQIAQEKIRYQAMHDLLTGLPNRTLFNEQLAVSLTQAAKNKTMLAVMFLDLDRFKTINDTLGHAVGDRLLQEVAQRLSRYLGEANIVARWGGDEFTVLLPEISDPKDAEVVAQKILDGLKPAFTLEGALGTSRSTSLHISTSIGIALYPHDGENAEILLSNADAALYGAKKQGRNNYQFYTAAMNSQASELLVLENDLHQALRRGEFVVYYQPQVKIETGEITGMEALVRWQHPKFGLLSPAKFISLAEETGLILPIGEWVLHTACTQAKVWQDAGLPPIRIGVNLSPRQFQQLSLCNSVVEILQHTQLSPQFLELEITESIAMQDVDKTRTILSDLHQMGVHLSIDDFGTGYSSLAYLKQFPLHTLKIDKSFVRDIAIDPQNAGIINAIMTLGKGFNLRVIAEGVETEAQKKCLHSFQCEEMQGYLFSPPLSAKNATQLLLNYLPTNGNFSLAAQATSTHLLKFG